MADVGAVAALVLAGVFAVAGVAKGRRPGATARAFAALGLPAAGLLSWAVPGAELGLAVLLWLRPRAGAPGALALLGVFSAVLLRQLRSGATAPCGCFGSATARPVSVADLARNGLLAAFACAALAAPAVPALPSFPAVVAVTAAGVAALVGLALVRLRLAVGRLLAVQLETGP